MEQIGSFIVAYKDVIVLVLAFVLWLVNFIVTCCSKKVKSVYDVLSLAIEMAPKVITQAETQFGSGNGELKKQFVLECLYSFMESRSSLSRKELVERYGSTIDKCIEDILATPEKKGGN